LRILICQIQNLAYIAWFREDVEDPFSASIEVGLVARFPLIKSSTLIWPDVPEIFRHMQAGSEHQGEMHRPKFMLSVRAVKILLNISISTST
jgi:hypothetical protein